MPVSLKGWPDILQLAVLGNNAGGAGAISDEDRSIICNIQNEIRQHPSNVAKQRTQVESSSSDNEADTLPLGRSNLDHADDVFPLMNFLKVTSQPLPSAGCSCISVCRFRLFGISLFLPASRPPDLGGALRY